jgi:hypothetical protein
MSASSLRGVCRGFEQSEVAEGIRSPERRSADRRAKGAGAEARRPLRCT